METRRISTHHAVIGIMLIIIGGVLLLNQLNMLSLYELGIDSVWHLWPLIFVISGIGKLADARNLFETGRGFWNIFLGVWLYVSLYHVYGLDFSTTWPAMLVAAGLSMVWRSLTNPKYTAYKEL